MTSELGMSLGRTTGILGCLLALSILSIHRTKGLSRYSRLNGGKEEQLARPIISLTTSVLQNSGEKTLEMPRRRLKARQRLNIHGQTVFKTFLEFLYYVLKSFQNTFKIFKSIYLILKNVYK